MTISMISLILPVIYPTLENTKLERLRMPPFQLRRLIIEALLNREYHVRSQEKNRRTCDVWTIV